MKPENVIPLVIKRAVKSLNRETAMLKLAHYRGFPSFPRGNPSKLDLANLDNIPFLHVALADMNLRPVEVKA